MFRLLLSVVLALMVAAPARATAILATNHEAFLASVGATPINLMDISNLPSGCNLDVTSCVVTFDSITLTTNSPVSPTSDGLLTLGSGAHDADDAVFSGGAWTAFSLGLLSFAEDLPTGYDTLHLLLHTLGGVESFSATTNGGTTWFDIVSDSAITSAAFYGDVLTTNTRITALAVGSGLVQVTPVSAAEPSSVLLLGVALLWLAHGLPGRPRWRPRL